jgi:LPS export ABC transporter protein LptC
MTKVLFLGEKIYLWIFCGVIYWHGCKEPVYQSAEKPVRDNKYPISQAYNVTYHYSEFGKPRAKLSAYCAKEFLGQNAEESYTRLERNLVIEFFDSLGAVESRLQADTAEIYDNQGIAVAWGNVAVTNSKGDRLETQKLRWRKKDQKIHTNTPVKIYTKDEVLVGDSLVASTNFQQYKIYKIRGSLKVSENE